jgi:SAM-dependent methyltransferase
MREQAVAAWGAVAERYADGLGRELDHKPFDRAFLDRFAALVPAGATVGDVGCGPGHVSRALADMSLAVHGIDLAPAMIDRARRDAPSLRFDVGDLLALPVAGGAWGGALALYSLIHVVRADLGHALGELARVVAPGGVLAVAVHAGAGLIESEEVFGVPVTLAATRFALDELAAAVSAAGFALLERTQRAPYPEEYPGERVYILARRRPDGADPA